ncbi:MAG: tRNA lysidine(34) synthetase TilS, partial [Oscillospiraceae bacterium]|nr:tRNA lysidine(34) synthetase TilS [Oscillospiraceae bacterium]
MIPKFKSAISKYKMLNDGDNVIVAVSGGADSMALLHLLLCYKTKMNLHIEVCHINHLIRGDEAYRDEAFVKDYCEKNGIPFHLLRADIPKLADECGKSLEECGRDVRYSFFAQTASKIGAKIATAHTHSDSIETLLLNIARGTGAKGLCGIPAVRGNIIRPLIFCTREDIETYNKENNVSFVDDSTNFSREYSRNKIRLDVVPILKELNPSLEKAVLRMFLQNAEDYECIEQIVATEYNSCVCDNKILLDNLKHKNKAILKRIVIKYLNNNGVGVDSTQLGLILELIEKNSGRVEIKKGLYVSVSNNLLFVETEREKTDYFEIPFIEGEHSILDYKIRVITQNANVYENFKKNEQKVLKNLIDYG